MTPPHDLSRFVTAQNTGGAYAAALGEPRAGRKQGHWMWFVFPQVAGLGRSAMAQHYAVAGLDEARDYLAHPVLGPRLLECAQTLVDLDADDPVAVLGGIDALKLCSSMTLFAAAAEHEEDREVFRAVLSRFYGGQEDPATIVRL